MTPRVSRAFALMVLIVGFAGQASSALAQDATPATTGDGSTAAAGDSAPSPSTATAGDESSPAGATPAMSVAPSPSGPVLAEDLQTADEAYNLKVRQLESRINELKEQIFRSKAKLTLLTEQVTGGLGSGGGAVVILRDDMGSAFLLKEVACFLDGAPLWTAYNEGGVKLRGTNPGEQVLYDGSLVEGSHTLSVQLVYTGNGSGVFSYLAGYTFRLKNSHTFEVEPGKVVKLVAVGFDKGGITTELTDRPALRFDTETKEEPRAKAPGT